MSFGGVGGLAVVRRWLAVGWALACVAVAAHAALQMLVSFAPTQGATADAAVAELAGLERARRFWWGGVWLASAMLGISGVAVAALAWRRGAEPGAAADGGARFVSGTHSSPVPRRG